MMATKSFFTDMVIDTPEAAANLEALIEEGRFWTCEGPDNFHMATREEIEAFIQKYEEEHNVKIRRLDEGNDETPEDP